MEGEQEYLLAGKIASKVRGLGFERLKVGTPLLELARFCDSEIEKLGARPAFPVNLSINDIAAHYTCSDSDETVFQENDVVKLDVGVQVNGYIADTSVTKCLGSKGADLKEAAEAALAAAEKVLAVGVSVSEIGAAVESEITSRGFKPIYNLTGHALKQWDLHAGLSIPNYKGMRGTIQDNCAIAIEPFSTDGDALVVDGALSEIYLITGKQPRLPQERAVLGALRAKFSTLPFASRWVGPTERPFLSRLSKSGVLHNYPILREQSKGLVAQAEHTFLISEGKVAVTTA